MAKKTTAAAAATKKAKPKKLETPVQKAVKANIASGKALEKAKTKHKTTTDHLNSLTK